MSPQRLQPVGSDSYLSAWGCLPFLNHSHILPQVNRGRRMDDGTLHNLIKIKASADLPARETKDVASNNFWCQYVWYGQPRRGAEGLCSCLQNLRLPGSRQACMTWTAVKGGADDSLCLLKTLSIQNLATPHHLHLIRDPIMSYLDHCSSLLTGLDSILAPLQPVTM